MPRLRNTGTGVVVNVSDETCALLDARTWKSADKPAVKAPVAAKKAVAKKAAASKSER